MATLPSGPVNRASDKHIRLVDIQRHGIAKNGFTEWISARLIRGGLFLSSWSESYDAVKLV